MKPRKISPRFSKREQLRRNPVNRRNRRSPSVRRLSSARSYSQGAAGF